MTEERNKLAELFAACWKDEALKARFMSDPKAVLAEHGLDVPANIGVNVVENSDKTVHITMPMAPEGAAGLSDEELSGAAGGSAFEAMFHSNCWGYQHCDNDDSAPT
jgi:hypothetical protein